MKFPGTVMVAYGKSLSGTIVIGMDGALKGTPVGIKWHNDNATYGEEMPNEVQAFIIKSLEADYGPVGLAALEAKETGDNREWRRLRDESRAALQQIANEATEMWKAL